MFGDHLENTLPSAHGVMFVRKLVIVNHLLRVVTPLVGAGQVGQGHDGGGEARGGGGGEDTVLAREAGHWVSLTVLSCQSLLSPFWLSVGAEVWFDCVLRAGGCPDLFVVKHRVERVPRVAVLREDSVPQPGPLVDKDLARRSKD